MNQTFFAKTFIGTPYYLSPEICEDKPYNDKSDVWALGCILYELCTYQHPFTAKSQGGLILKILNDNPKPIDKYYSKELGSLIDILFNKDYQKRPSCEEILRMNCVLEKAKSLNIFDDIKSSFPNIDTPIEKLKNNKINDKPISAHAKPIIKSVNKNIKKPASNYGIFAKGGYKNIKFNNIKPGEKKKSQNQKVLVYPNKEKNGAIQRKVIKIVNKDNNNINKSNNKKVRKKVVVNPNPSKKDILLVEAEKFKKNCLLNKDKIKINNIHLNNDKKPLKENENENNKVKNIKDSNNKETNNIVETKEETNIDQSKKNDNNDTINQNKEWNYCKDSQMDIFESKNNDANKKNIVLEETKDNKEKKDNNNDSIESDIYMTGKKEIYQPQKKEEKKEDKKEEKYYLGKEMENSLPLMKTVEFNEMLSDFDKTKDEKVNDNLNVENDNNRINIADNNNGFNIIDNNNDHNIVDNNNDNTINKKEDNIDFNIVDNNDNNNKNSDDLKKSDFAIIDNNNEESQRINKLLNLDNNKSMSSCEEDENDNVNNNENSNEESDNAEEKETVTAIDNEEEVENDDNDNDINIDKDNNNDKDEEKSRLKKELEELKGKIDNKKKEILKLIGEEKYDYIMKISSEGIKDDKKQEEVGGEIEKFIKENIKDSNEGELYNIYSLFILECQLYKKQENLNKL